MANIVSRPYSADPKLVCERCVFGKGEHSDWCERFGESFVGSWNKLRTIDVPPKHGMSNAILAVPRWFGE